MLKMLIYLKFQLVLIIFIFLITGLPVYSMSDPSAVYCESLGYEYTIKQVSEGEIGVCIFPDTTSADAWDFLVGKEALDWSYCTQNGYEVEYSNDFELCGTSDECTICILENGTKIEATKLMNLSFEEGSCGDTICVLGEDYLTCPQDCPSGFIDGYCDGVSDGICDQDCLFQLTPESDSDCPLCGDGVCDDGETSGTCSQDCPSQICGDGKCDAGETHETCCVDCGCVGGMKCQNNKCVKIEICGDGTCSIHETYEKCKEDCPSGSEDDYCDKVEDGICDPDCTRTRDVDCLCNRDGICESNFETNSNCPEDCKSDNILIYLILGAIVISSIIILLKTRSKKTNPKWKEVYEETPN